MSGGNEGGNIMSMRGIVNRFGNQTVHDKLDLDIVSGEILGIAGGSGSGKSVLLRTLAGLHQPQAGKVLAGGRPVASLLPAERAAFIGVLFQQGALFSSLSVADNIMLPMREHTPLAPDQQAALARALALDPRVLLLDEPTSGLDPTSAGDIDLLIRQLSDSLGVTVVVVTHDLNTLFGVCDRVAVLAGGKVTVGTPAMLMRDKNEGVREFLSGTRAIAAMTAWSDAGGNEKRLGHN